MSLRYFTCLVGLCLGLATPLAARSTIDVEDVSGGGSIEDDVRAVDVSPDNDWSEVRVWYAPIQDLGGTHWPVTGFIYNQKAKPAETTLERGLSGTDDPIGAIIAARQAPAALKPSRLADSRQDLRTRLRPGR